MLTEQPSVLPTMGQAHLMMRKHLADRHAHLLDNFMKANSHKQKYWILGKVKCKRKDGKTMIKPVLEAFDTQPDVTKEAYLYEVDNTLGTKTLLWVMHPNNKLSLPSIGKSIHVSGDTSE